MKRVKRFCAVAKAVLQLISKLLPVVGDVMECIKMVDTLVDSFVEKRKNGQLKELTFAEYAQEIINLISEIAPLGYSFIESVELLVNYAHNFGQNIKDNGGSLGE